MNVKFTSFLSSDIQGKNLWGLRIKMWNYNKMMKHYNGISDELADIERYMDEIRPSKRKGGYAKSNKRKGGYVKSNKRKGGYTECTGLTEVTLKGLAKYLNLEYTGEDVVYGKIKRS